MEKERKQQFWIHRISYCAEISYPLLESGYLTYGFSDFAENAEGDFIAQCRKGEGGWDYLEDQMIKCWDGLSRNRYQLWRFICEMKAGDWVLVPSYRTFSIYELLEDAPLRVKDIRDVVIKDWNEKEVSRRDDGALLDSNKQVIDLGFARRVKKVVKDIPREEYADAALISRMKVRQTDVNIDDLAGSVNNALQRFKNNHPIHFKEDVMESMIPIVGNLIWQDMSPNKFEALIRWYFERIGGSATVLSKNPHGKKGDEDVDVNAVFEPLKLVVNVQAKFHVGETDKWAAVQIEQAKKSRQFDRLDDGYSSLYWVISSAEKYSESCVKLAEENSIQLIDGKTFARMLLDAGLMNLPL